MSGSFTRMRLLEHNLAIVVLLSLFGCAGDDSGGGGRDDSAAGETPSSSTGADADATPTSGPSGDGSSQTDESVGDGEETGDDPFTLHTCPFTQDCGVSFPGDCESYPETCEAYDGPTVCALEALRDDAAFRVEEECCGLGPLGLTHVIADGRNEMLTQFRGEGDTVPGVHFGAVKRCVPKDRSYFETCLAAFDPTCRRTYEWWDSCETVEAPSCP